MRGILDTHAFLWAAENDPKLSAAARAFISDPANTVYVSAVSVWELVIKVTRGKLRLADSVGTLVARLPAAGMTILSVRVEHALAVQQLPDPHHDPFDCLLVAQAVVEGAVLVSCDEILTKYPVTVVW